MPIIKSFVQKEVAALETGELFAFDAGERALCLAIGPHQDTERRLVVVLTPEPQHPHPTWARLPPDTDCIAYGVDWMIDLDDARDSVPGAVDPMRLPGSIIVGSTGTLLRAASVTSSATGGSVTVDLEVFALSNRSPDPHSSICVRRWTLWLNAAERLRPGARPLFEFAG